MNLSTKEEWVKIPQNPVNVIYGCPLIYLANERQCTQRDYEQQQSAIESATNQIPCKLRKIPIDLTNPDYSDNGYIPRPNQIMVPFMFLSCGRTGVS